MNKTIVSKLIDNCVKNLKEFGYPSVNEENIFTDIIYSAFFKKMLENSKGNGVDEEIEHLLKQIKIIL